MTLKLTKKIGDVVVQIDLDDGGNLPKALIGADWLLNAPSHCDACGSADLHFQGRRVVAKDGKNKGKTFDYGEIRCGKCYAKATLGKNADFEGYFWRKDENYKAFIAYKKPGQVTEETTAPAETDDVSDDIPF